MYLTRVFILYFIYICLICNVIINTEFRIFTTSIFNIISVTNIAISKITARTFNILPNTINITVFSSELFALALTLTSFSLQQQKQQKTCLLMLLIKYLLMLFNDIHKEKLCFIQLSTRMAAWLLLTFFVCLHSHLRLYIPLSRIKCTDV